MEQLDGGLTVHFSPSEARQGLSCLFQVCDAVLLVSVMVMSGLGLCTQSRKLDSLGYLMWDIKDLDMGTEF